MFGRNTNAIVTHSYFHLPRRPWVVVQALSWHSNLSPFGSVLNGVVQEVGKDLHQAILIPPDQRNIPLDAHIYGDVFSLSTWSLGRYRLINYPWDIDGSPFYIDLSLLDFRDVQNIVDQSCETIGLLIDNVQKLHPLINIAIRPFE